MFLVKFFATISSFLSAQTLQPTSFGSWFESFGMWLAKVGNDIGNFVTNLLYGACKWLLAFTDFLQYFIQKLIGLDYWLNSPYYTIEGATESDLLFSFLYNDTVQKTFRALCSVGLVLLIIFTIFAIIRSEWQYIAGGGDGRGQFGDGSNSKATVIRNAIKAIALVIVFPIILIFGIISSDAILASIVKALNIDTGSTFGATLFGISTQSANRYRNYAESEARAPITDEITFYMSSDNKYIYLSNNASPTVPTSNDYAIGYGSYDAYQVAIATATEYTVNSVFRPVDMNNGSFSGFCVSIDVDGESKYYLVEASSEDQLAYYYYLRNVLQVPLMTKTNSIGNNSLLKDLKSKMNGRGFISGFAITSYDMNSQVGKAVHNTWAYSTIFNQTINFVETLSYTTLSQGDTYLNELTSIDYNVLTALGLENVDNVKVMYNSNLISSYFDGGQFGLVQLQSEYGVMSDIVDFMTQNDLTLYMMNVNSSLINWTYSGYSNVDSKWVGVVGDGKIYSTSDTNENGVLTYSAFENATLKSSGLYGKIPFVVSYSDAISDVEAGNVLYLADSEASNEKDGALFIMCFKVVEGTTTTYVPIIHNRPYTDPMTNKTYKFDSNYYTADYNGVILARGIMQSDYSNSDYGSPTYIQEKTYINDEEQTSISTDSSYYYDLEITGGVAQFAVPYVPNDTSNNSGLSTESFYVTSISYSDDNSEEDTDYSVVQVYENFKFQNSYEFYKDGSELSIDSTNISNVSVNTTYLGTSYSANYVDVSVSGNGGTFYLFSFDTSDKEIYFSVFANSNVLNIYESSDIVENTTNVNFKPAGEGGFLNSFLECQGICQRYTIKAVEVEMAELENPNSINLDASDVIEVGTFNPGDLTHNTVEGANDVFTTVNRVNINGSYSFANVLFNTLYGGTENTGELINFTSNGTNCSVQFASPVKQASVAATSVKYVFRLYNFYTAAANNGQLYEYNIGSETAEAITETPIGELDSDKSIIILINSNFSWDSRANALDLYNGKNYIATIYKNLGTTCETESELSEVTLEILYNQKTYYNIQTQNKYSDQNAIENYYKTLSATFITTFHRGSVEAKVGRADAWFNFFGWRPGVTISTYDFIRDKQSGTYFQISNGIDFDYFFDGDISLSTFFIPVKISYWVIIIASILIIKTLATAIWGVIKRFYEITLYFLAMPVMASTIPLETNGGGGRRFTDSIQRPLIQKVLSTYGVIIGINVFFILLTPIKSISQVFTDADIATSGSYFLTKLHFSAKVLNNFVYILFMLVAFTMIDALPEMVSRMLGVEGSGVLSSGKQAVDATKKNMHTAGNALTGAPLVKAWDTGKQMVGNSVIGRGVKALGSGMNKAKDRFNKGKNEGDKENESNVAPGPTTGGDGGSEGGDSHNKIDEPEGGSAAGAAAAAAGAATARSMTGDLSSATSGPSASPIATAARDTADEMDGVSDSSIENSYNEENGLNPAGDKDMAESASSEMVREMATGDTEQAQIANQIAAQVIKDKSKSSSDNLTESDVINGKNGKTGLMKDVSMDAKINAVRSTISDPKELEAFDKQFKDNDGKQLQGKALEKAQKKALENFDVKGEIDKETGELKFAVQKKDNKGNTIGEAKQVSADASKKLTSEILNSPNVGSRQINNATKNLSGQVQEKIKGVAGANLVLAAGSASTGSLNEAVINKARENQDIRGEATLRTLESSDNGKKILTSILANHKISEEDLQDSEKRKQIAKFIIDAQDSKDGNDALKLHLKNNDDKFKNNLLSTAKEEARNGNFRVTAWDLASDQEKEAYRAKKQAELDSRKSSSILEGATEEEKTSIIANTAKQVIADPALKNSELAKNIQNAVFAGNITDEELKDIDPAMLKAITGKSSAEELTDKDRAFIGFIKKNQENNSLDNFDYEDSQVLGKLKSQFNTSEGRNNAISKFSEQDISDSISKNEILTGLVGGIATKVATISLSSEQKQALATKTIEELQSFDKNELIESARVSLVNKDIDDKKIQELTGREDATAENLNDEELTLIGFIKKENGGKFTGNLNDLGATKKKLEKFSDDSYVKSVENKIFAGNVTKEDLDNLSPESLKLITGKDDATIDNLTNDKLALIGFIKKKNGSLENIDIKKEELAYNNSSERKIQFAKFSDSEIASIVSTNTDLVTLGIENVVSMDKARSFANESYSVSQSNLERAKKLDETNHESQKLINANDDRQFIAATNAKLDGKSDTTYEAIKASMGFALISGNSEENKKQIEELTQKGFLTQEYIDSQRNSGKTDKEILEAYNKEILQSRLGNFTSADIEELKAQGMNEEEIAIAYEKAKLAGKLTDKNGKPVSTDVLIGIVADVKENNEADTIALQALYTNAMSNDASKEDRSRYLAAKNVILGSLSQEQKDALPGVSALTRDEENQLKLRQIRTDEATKTDLKIAKLTKNTIVSEEEIRKIAEKDENYKKQFKDTLGKDIEESSEEERQNFYNKFNIAKNKSAMVKFEKTAKENKLLIESGMYGEGSQAEEAIEKLGGISRGLALKKASKAYADVDVSDEEIVELLDNPQNANLAEKVNKQIDGMPLGVAMRLLYGTDANGSGDKFVAETRNNERQEAIGIAKKDGELRSKILEEKKENLLTDDRIVLAARTLVSDKNNNEAQKIAQEFTKATGKDFENATSQEILSFLNSSNGKNSKKIITGNIEKNVEAITDNDVLSYLNKKGNEDVKADYMLRARASIANKGLDSISVTDDEIARKAFEDGYDQTLANRNKQNAAMQKEEQKAKEEKALAEVGLDSVDNSQEQVDILATAVKKQSDVGKQISSFATSNQTLFDEYKKQKHAETHFNETNFFNYGSISNETLSKLVDRDISSEKDLTQKEKEFVYYAYRNNGMKTENLDALNTEKISSIRQEFDKKRNTSDEELKAQFFIDNRNDQTAQQNYLTEQVKEGTELGKQIDAFSKVDEFKEYAENITKDSYTTEEIAEAAKQDSNFIAQFNRFVSNENNRSKIGNIDINQATAKEIGVFIKETGYDTSSLKDSIDKKYREENEADIKTRFYIEKFGKGTEEKNNKQQEFVSAMIDLQNGTEKGTEIATYLKINAKKYQEFEEDYKKTHEDATDAEIQAKFYSEKLTTEKKEQQKQQVADILNLEQETEVGKNMEAFIEENKGDYKTFAKNYKKAHKGEKIDENVIKTAFIAESREKYKTNGEQETINEFVLGYVNTFVNKNEVNKFSDKEENRVEFESFATAYAENVGNLETSTFAKKNRDSYNSFKKEYKIENAQKEISRYTKLNEKEYEAFEANYKETHKKATDTEIQASFYLQGENKEEIDEFIKSNDKGYQVFKSNYQATHKNATDAEIQANYFIQKKNENNVLESDIEKAFYAQNNQEIKTAFFANNLDKAFPELAKSAKTSYYLSHPETIKVYTENYVAKHFSKETINKYAEENADLFREFGSEYVKNVNVDELEKFATDNKVDFEKFKQDNSGLNELDAKREFFAQKFDIFKSDKVKNAFYADRLPESTPDIAKEIITKYYSRGSQSFVDYTTEQLNKQMQGKGGNILKNKVSLFTENNYDKFKEFSSKYVEQQVTNKNFTVEQIKEFYNKSEDLSKIGFNDAVIRKKIASGEINPEDIYSYANRDNNKDDYKAFKSGYKQSNPNKGEEDIKIAFLASRVGNAEYGEDIDKNLNGLQTDIYKEYFAENNFDVKTAFYAHNIEKINKNYANKARESFYNENKNEDIENYVANNQFVYNNFAKQYKKENGNDVDERIIKAEFYADYSRQLYGLIDETKSTINDNKEGLVSIDFAGVDEVTQRQIESANSQNFELVSAKNDNNFKNYVRQHYDGMKVSSLSSTELSEIYNNYKSNTDVTSIQDNAKKLKFIAEKSGIDVTSDEGLAQINALAKDKEKLNNEFSNLVTNNVTLTDHEKISNGITNYGASTYEIIDTDAKILASLTTEEKAYYAEKVRREKIAINTLNSEINNNSFAGQQAKAYVELNRDSYSAYLVKNNLKDNTYAMAKFVTSEIEKTETPNSDETKIQAEKIKKNFEIAAEMVGSKDHLESYVMGGKQHLRKFDQKELEGTNLSVMIGKAESMTTSNLLYEVNRGTVKGQTITNFASINIDEYKNFKNELLSGENADKYKGNESLIMVEFYKKKAKDIEQDESKYSPIEIEQVKTALSRPSNEISDDVNEFINKNENEFADFRKQKANENLSENELKASFYVERNESLDKKKLSAYVRSNGDSTQKTISDIFEQKNLTINPAANSKAIITDIEILKSKSNRTKFDEDIITQNKELVTSAIENDENTQINALGNIKNSENTKQTIDKVIASYADINENNISTRLTETKLNEEDIETLRNSGLSDYDILVNYQKAKFAFKDTENVNVESIIKAHNGDESITKLALETIGSENNDNAVRARKTLTEEVKNNAELHNELVNAVELSGSITLNESQKNRLKASLKKDGYSANQIEEKMATMSYLEIGDRLNLSISKDSEQIKIRDVMANLEKSKPTVSKEAYNVTTDTVDLFATNVSDLSSERQKNVYDSIVDENIEELKKNVDKKEILLDRTDVSTSTILSQAKRNRKFIEYLNNNNVSVKNATKADFDAFTKLNLDESNKIVENAKKSKLISENKNVFVDSIKNNKEVLQEYEKATGKKATTATDNQLLNFFTKNVSSNLTLRKNRANIESETLNKLAKNEEVTADYLKSRIQTAGEDDAVVKAVSQKANMLSVSELQKKAGIDTTKLDVSTEVVDRMVLAYAGVNSGNAREKLTKLVESGEVNIDKNTINNMTNNDIEKYFISYNRSKLDKNSQGTDNAAVLKAMQDLATKDDAKDEDKLAYNFAKEELVDIKNESTKSNEASEYRTTSAQRSISASIDEIRADASEMSKIRHTKLKETGDPSVNVVEIQDTRSDFDRELDQMFGGVTQKRTQMSMDEILDSIEQDIQKQSYVDQTYKAEASLITTEQEQDHLASSRNSGDRAKRLMGRILTGSGNLDDDERNSAEFNNKLKNKILAKKTDADKNLSDDDFVAKFMQENVVDVMDLENEIRNEQNNEKLARMAMGIDGMDSIKADIVRQDNNTLQKIAREFKKTHNGLDFNTLDITEQNAYLAKKYNDMPEIHKNTDEIYLDSLAKKNVINSTSINKLRQRAEREAMSIEGYLASGKADDLINSGYRRSDIDYSKSKNDGSLEQLAIKNMDNEIFDKMRTKITTDKTDSTASVFREERRSIVEDKVDQRIAEGKVNPITVLPDVTKMNERQRLEFQATQVMLANEIREGTAPDVLKNILNNTSLVNEEQILKNLAKSANIDINNYIAKDSSGNDVIDKEALLEKIGSQNINNYFNENYEMRETLLSIGANDLLLTVNKDQRALQHIEALNNNANLRNEVCLRQFKQENSSITSQNSKIMSYVRNNTALTSAEKRDIERDVKNDIRKQIMDELKKQNPSMSTREMNKKIDREGLDNLVSSKNKVSDNEIIKSVISDKERSAIELKVRNENKSSSSEELKELISKEINLEANMRIADKLGKDISNVKKEDLQSGISVSALGLSKVEISGVLARQDTITERKIAQKYGNYKEVENKNIKSVYDESHNELLVGKKERQEIENSIHSDKANANKSEDEIQVLINSKLKVRGAEIRSQINTNNKGEKAETLIQETMNKNLAESMGVDTSDIKGQTMSKQELNSHLVSNERKKEIEREVKANNVGKTSSQIQSLINEKIEFEANEKIASKFNIAGTGLASVNKFENNKSILKESMINRNELLLKVASSEYTDKYGKIKDTSKQKIAQTAENLKNSGKAVKFSESMYNQVLKNSSFTSQMTDEELKAFLETNSMSGTENLGIKNGAKNLKEAVGQFFTSTGKNIATGVTEGVPHAFKNVLFKITKRTPQNSAYYNNWNTSIQNQIQEVKEGKGAYENLTDEQRNEKVDELKNKLIFTNNSKPSNYNSMTSAEKLEYERNQTRLKHEAFKTTNPNYIKNKVHIKGSGNKSFFDNVGASLHIQGKNVSENIKAQHKKDLSIVKSSITEYNATKTHLDFVNNFDNIANKFLGRNSNLSKSVIKKAQSAQTVKEKQQILEEAMAKRYKIASHRVAHDSGVSRKDFLEERGIGETVVRYKDASKKYTALKSRINTHLPIPGLNAAINGVSYAIKKGIVDRFDRKNDNGEKVGRFTRWAYDRVYGRKSQEGLVAAQTRKQMLEVDMNKLEKFNLTFKGTASEYSQQVKEILGPTADKIYGKTFKLYNENSAVSIQQRGVMKTLTQLINQENKRIKYTSNIIPAASDTAAQFIGKSLTNGKTKSQIENDKVIAENINKSLNLVSTQKNVSSFDSVFARLLPQIKEQFDNRKLKLYDNDEFKLLDDSKKFEILENYLKKQLNKANRRVNNNSMLNSGKENLEKLNGMYFKRSEINHTKTSGTMQDAILKSNENYKRIVENYNISKNRYETELQHKNNLNLELINLRNTPVNSYTKKEMYRLYEQIKESEIRLKTLSTAFERDKGAKEQFEKSFATQQSITAKMSNNNLFINSKTNAFDTHDFYRQVSGPNGMYYAKINPNSTDGKQIDMITRRYMTQLNSHVDLMRRSDLMDAMLKEYIDQANIQQDITFRTSMFWSRKLDRLMFARQKALMNENELQEKAIKQNKYLTEQNRIDSRNTIRRNQDLIQEIELMRARLNKINNDFSIAMKKQGVKMEERLEEVNRNTNDSRFDAYRGQTNAKLRSLEDRITGKFRGIDDKIDSKVSQSEERTNRKYNQIDESVDKLMNENYIDNRKTEEKLDELIRNTQPGSTEHTEIEKVKDINKRKNDKNKNNKR